jgi:hypothetical protein
MDDSSEPVSGKHYSGFDPYILFFERVTSAVPPAFLKPDLQVDFLTIQEVREELKKRNIPYTWNTGEAKLRAKLTAATTSTTSKKRVQEAASDETTKVSRRKTK